MAAHLLSRNYIGIDRNPDAVSLAQKRLKNPIRTDSKVLARGREAYKSKDSSVMELLRGLEIHPVPRNKGIDAILAEQYEGTPVLIRVQKKGEPLVEVIKRVGGAMKKKRSVRAFLIQTERVETPVEIPKGMSLIRSPALQVTDFLQEGDTRNS